MPKKYGTPNFDPLDAIEGDPKSPIWIIGINPKTAPDEHAPNQPNPIDWKSTHPNAPHFQRLQRIVGDQWYTCLFKEGGIAHTDLIKCGSPSYSEEAKGAVEHCKGFLLEQISKHKPKLLLVLSSAAAEIIQGEAKIPDGCTEGMWKIGNHQCHVVLSGYSSPFQDRYARLRLMKEFINACKLVGLNPPAAINS